MKSLLKQRCMTSIHKKYSPTTKMNFPRLVFFYVKNIHFHHSVDEILQVEMVKLDEHLLLHKMNFNLLIASSSCIKVKLLIKACKLLWMYYKNNKLRRKKMSDEF